MGISPPVPEELFSIDAYLQQFDSGALEVDREQGRIALARTAFYPGGGGQPHDTGSMTWDGGQAAVVRVGRHEGRIWHWLEGDELPAPGTEVLGTLDWGRRHLLMRTHTALHVLCGVVWADYRVAVTGGNMEPGVGRIDFELDAMSVELGRRLEQRVNEEIARAHEILVEFLARAEADVDPALIRTKANLIPAHIDPLRVIDIVGLDRQADGGTHVATTAEVGQVEVLKTESKGRANKRVRLAVTDAPRSADSV
ncbi:MAG: alanyl-tRNA editing protein [Actinomycetota bacterium]|nr:alanyl-tRNA editing protein [Actinomycetota bacterium]MDQ6945301.1 alanyl-tRNA editing protein [Actinomycetota bacterium]